MSFRRRMVLLAAGAVAAAIVMASIVVYVVTRNELRGRIDASLHATVTPGLPQAVRLAPRLGAAELATLKKSGKQANGGLAQLEPGVARATAPAGGSASGAGNISTETRRVSGGEVQVRTSRGAHGEEVTIERRTVVVPNGSSVNRPLAEARAVHLVLPSPKLGEPQGYVQLSEPNGNVLTAGRGPVLPLSAAARAVASGKRDSFFSDARVAGTPARVLTERAPEGGVWQVALPLSDAESTLTQLKLVLAIVCLGGIALAAGLGLVVSRAALVPVRRLTGAAERVARTQDLGHRIEAGDRDELGRLATSFNTMLAALERSRLAQRQLMSDASHELRTPLTSVQANLDALALGEQLPPRERARVVAAARAQLHELTVLVGDLVDLSKTEVDEVEIEDVRLDLAVTGAIERARLQWAGGHSCTFALDAEPCLVRAAPARLDRAIANLLDNACKWNPTSPFAGPVEVRVRDGRLEVRDHGPGIVAEDLPRVFDRLYRSPEARGRPGSGLGLAIVRQAAEAHDGWVHATNDPDGGARLTLKLPQVQMSAAELRAAERDAPPTSESVH
ncbi:MAG TPA: HAMP domain-containing sensor histidine kinase [Solirubrobacteraceae bacterium]|jgi:two-component system sensor histidine kinase MprB|nr:HAMP domain-containing sensor histidine kinase [Solirubrobacteraceae bacterium]